jgi:hypothetical protein
MTTAMGAKKQSPSSEHPPRRSLVCVVALARVILSMHPCGVEGLTTATCRRWTINPQELDRQHRRSVGSQSPSARARRRGGARRRFLSTSSCLSSQMWHRRLGRTDLRSCLTWTEGKTLI